MRGRHGIGWVTLIRFFMGRLEVDHGRRETTMADHGWPLPWSWRAVADHGFLGGNSKDVFKHSFQTSNLSSLVCSGRGYGIPDAIATAQAYLKRSRDFEAALH